MKKIADFIVDKRYLILTTFILLSCLCLFLGNKVTINDDFSKYLPSDSETRLGMDIMANNFPEMKSSSLYVMFKDLNEEEKSSIKTELESYADVTVDYDNSEDFNKENNTLYILNLTDTDDSDSAKNLYTSIQDKYQDYDVYFGGSIAEANKPVINTAVIAIAIGFAMIILIIMCNSYIEPFLFLFTIGIGVFLNKGTNIIFSSVSNVTDSISAILQMALSMDYSIMLMNRYRQEKETEKNNVKAMKKALHDAFGSISSSSITTIVGLLALVFMSFTIGRDLGFVLAKGVLFSLISIFFVLPGLILMFDKLITKTQKKSFNFNLNKLGNFIYKMRYVNTILFVGLFVGSFLLKGNLNILYTDAETDEIKNVFAENNQIAVIYQNDYEEEISNYCNNPSLQNNDKVTEILCYGNTLNKDFSATELNAQLKNYANDIKIDDDLIKILYYNYYNPEDNTTISLNNLVNFIKDNANNELIKDKIDDNILDNLERLTYFTAKDKINTNYDAQKLAEILGIKQNDIKNLLVYYNAQNKITTKMNLTQFVTILNKDILPNPTYANLLDNQAKTQINKLLPFTDNSLITRPMNYQELANIFGIDAESVKNLMLLANLNGETDKAITFQEFIIAVKNLQENTSYLNSQDLTSILALYPFAMNENDINNTQMKKEQLQKIFDKIAPNLVTMVYQNLPAEKTFSPNEFITFVLGSSLPKDSLNNLKLISLVMNDTQTKYTASNLAKLLNQDAKNFINIYNLIDFSEGKWQDWQLTPNELVNIIIANQDNPTIQSSVDKNTLSELTTLQKVMQGIISNTSYTYNELAKLFNMDEENIKLLYSLYETNYNHKNVKVSLDTFINFITNDVLKNANLASQFTEENKKQITNIKTIIADTLKEKTYTKDEAYATLNKLTNDLNQNMVDLIYMYYGTVNNYQDNWTMTIEKFVNYLNNDILNDERFGEFIDNDMNSSIKDAQKLVTDSKELLISDNYSRMILNTTYAAEGKETFDFIQSIKDALNSENKEIYVIGNSPMAYDISNSFDSEMNFITILTMIAIFVVVAITFKSILIPLVLVLIIQCAVYITMGILSLLGGSVYFIALLIVQSILMGATIDYAILYTSYYLESRETLNISEAIKNAYNKSIHTILTSSSILIIVTLIVGNFASAIAAKICKTISEGTLCSLLLILLVLPPLLALFDKWIIKKHKKID